MIGIEPDKNLAVFFEMPSKGPYLASREDSFGVALGTCSVPVEAPWGFDGGGWMTESMLLSKHA